MMVDLFIGIGMLLVLVSIAIVTVEVGEALWRHVWK